MVRIREVAVDKEAENKTKGITPEEFHALNLLETTNIPRNRIARDMNITYNRLMYLQQETGIQRPEQVFGLPKREVPVRQRKPRTPRNKKD